MAHELDGLGVSVQHILTGGSLESHGDAMNRLLTQFKMDPEDDLATDRRATIAAAVAHQAGRVAYVRRSTKASLGTPTP